MPALDSGGRDGGVSLFTPNLRAGRESGDEFAPSKANAHLPLLCREPYEARIARLKLVVLILGRLQVVGCGN